MGFFEQLLHSKDRNDFSPDLDPFEAEGAPSPLVIERLERALAARRSAMYELLGFIDEVCMGRGIGYFIYSDTLKGAVNYEDFVPQSGKVHLGMLREDYDRFASVVGPLAEERGYVFETSVGWFGNVVRRMPRLCAYRPAIPEVGREPEFEADGSPVMKLHCIELSIFDSIPDSYDARKGHFRRMKRLNRRHARINDARAVLMGRKSIRSFKHFRRVVWHLPKFRAHCARRLVKQAQRYNGQGMAQVARVAGGRAAIVDRDKLAPYGRIRFGPLVVNCPNDPSVWAPKVTEENMQEVRQLQESVKRILVEFDRVCRELGIGYFVCGGTLLGYARHQGFIPWDDDMDVAMLRADYDRFRAEAGPLLDEEFFLQTRESDPNIPNLFTKIRINGTEYITQYNERRDFHKGICLDIFPFDAIPNGEGEQQRFAERVRKRARRHHRVVNRQVPPVAYTEPPRGLEERWFRLFGRVHRWVYWHIPLTLTQDRYIKLATKYNSKAKQEGLECVASFTPSYTFIRLDDLLPYQDVTYEDITVKVPRRPEVFLEMQYGDFMELPPIHKRIGHGLLRWADVEAERDNPTTDM
jgi:lipopolysaccharide cholinephosphotransferase